MIYDIRQIIREIKSFMTLEDGDIIMTGTPKGVGNYRQSDCFNAVLVLDGEKALECSWTAK
jgi:2-keto-4-pentenoate hydratase/2-oxohepta-3-ene-1,7-dioic acid hydratase in catechol pathway